MSNQYLLGFKKETDKYFIQKLEERFSSEIEEEENMINSEQYMYIELNGTKIIIAEAGHEDDDEDENYYYCRAYKEILDEIQKEKLMHKHTIDHIDDIFKELDENLFKKEQ
jgi:hypothetical protein